ncbi:MAG: SGNH/GDSL hydrolase family protein [Verrucomicrobium sp.]
MSLRRSTFLLLALSMGLHATFPASLAAADAPAAPSAPAKKRILLLGDSISIGYTPFVQEKLADKAVVLRPMNKANKAENCSGTTFGVQHIDRWLQIDGGKWDVIHFNWGLHDLKHVLPEDPTKTSDKATDPPQATVEVYEKQLREIVAKLQATGARLVFATTTYVPEGPQKVYRSNADVERYNAAALAIMKEKNIAVDDLYTASKVNYQA